jgi:lysophospholipase L1-like esterase
MDTKERCSYTSSSLQQDFARIIRRATAPGAAPTLLFTIFLGANDACMIGDTESVPWLLFSANYHNFIDTILSHDALVDTKIVLITPPPINGNVLELQEGMSETEAEEVNRWRKSGPSHKTYMSKKRYADGIMQIAGEYEETGRVAGLNFWQDIVDAMLKEEGETYNAEMPPGCGLLGASAFPDGWFTDGLHLNVKGYNVLSKGLTDLVTEKWPELAPEKL